MREILMAAGAWPVEKTFKSRTLT